MKWVKIDSKTFDVVDGTVQLSTGSHATIYLSFNIGSHYDYYTHFIKLYESNNRFNVTGSRFIASGALIKSIDTDFTNSMNLSIKCDVLNTTDIQIRRDDIIDDILKDETLPDNNNII